MQFLTFHLYGPLQSWGEVAVGEVRGSQGHPTKSGVLGLVAAALGLTRQQDQEHLHLNRVLGFAVRVNQPGTILRDYHTVQAPKKERFAFATRKDELERGDLKALITRRDYRQEACYSVALWAREPYSLETLAEAMKQPHFLPYLGRKSCAPAYPLLPVLTHQENLKDAFQATPLPDELAFLGPKNGETSLYWEGEDSGLEVRFTNTRRDGILNRTRRTFHNRQEHHGVLANKE